MVIVVIVILFYNAHHHSDKTYAGKSSIMRSITVQYKEKLT